MNNKWLDLSNNANKFNQSYFKGFIDINDGNVIIRDDNYLNLHNKTSDTVQFSINSTTMKIYDNTTSSYVDVSNSKLLWIRDLSANAQTQLNTITQRIQNITTDASFITTVSGDVTINNVLKVGNNVGINKNPSPNYALDVSGKVLCNSIEFSDTSNQRGVNISPFLNVSGDIIVSGDLSLNSRLCVNNTSIFNGKIGIGVSSPVCPLDVAIGNTFSTDDSSANTYFNSSNSVDLSNSSTGYSSNYSILSRGSILTGGSVVTTNTITYSDNRIKTNVLNIDGTSAVKILRQILPKQFKYKDNLYHGSSPNYGFIAQEVENVFENAVNRITKFIPNIFELCDVTNGNIVNLKNTSTKELIYDEEENTINPIKLFDENNNEIVTTIKCIMNDKQFKLTNPLDKPNIFVYGQEVKDFRIVDKDKIFTIAVAAFKEIDIELQDTKNELQDTKTELQELKKTVTTQQHLIEKILMNMTTVTI